MGSASKHVLRECDNCGEEIRAYGHRKELDEIFCSRECMSDYKRVDRVCRHCGTGFEILRSSLSNGRKNTGRYCSKDCMDEWRSENWVGENNPLTIDSTVECDTCGVEFKKRPAKIEMYDNHFCSRDCVGEWISEHNTGENHPRWKGGHVEYGPLWYQARRDAKERDNHTCQGCGVHQDDLGKRLHVHHIIPVREFDDVDDAHGLGNLVTLCISCHAKYEGLYLRPDAR